MLSAFDLIAVLVVLTAIFGWLNHVAIGLPHAIGLLVMGLLSSLILIAAEIALLDVSLYEDLRRVMMQIDFQHAVLDGMLAFLLFACALHVDFAVMRSRAWAIGLMATFGVLISTFVLGIASGSEPRPDAGRQCDTLRAMDHAAADGCAGGGGRARHPCLGAPHHG